MPNAWRADYPTALQHPFDFADIRIVDWQCVAQQCPAIRDCVTRRQARDRSRGDGDRRQD
ncbi:hypothetical protein VZG47_09060 [Synechococcus elongatus IITB5]